MSVRVLPVLAAALPANAEGLLRQSVTLPG